VSEDKAYAITITINEPRDKLARWQRIHVTPEIVEDEAVLGSLLALTAKKMIRDIEENGDEVRKNRL
jgi:hypothetical protein